MKKLAIMIGLSIAGITMAQQWNGSTLSTGIISRTGSVGIGTTTPTASLSIQTGVSNDGIRIIQTGTTGACLGLYNSSIGARNWSLYSTGSTNAQGAGNFIIYDNSGGGSGSERIFIKGATGNVGLGTTSPLQKLDVNGAINVSAGVIQKGGAQITNTADLGLYSLDATTWMRFVTNNQPIRFFSDASANSVGANSLVSIEPNGKVVIGSGMSLLGSYKLYVETGILTEKVKVAIKNSTQWSDFVFDKDYKLLSLSEVETYIAKNKHLPGIPSAKEVVKNGIDLGDMDAKLLQKIEELTLHIIKLEKEINILKENK
jgi:trimeric autotransporter adhesin